MTSKLKCPFCGEELDYDEYGWDYSCPNHKCRATKGVLCGTKSLWQALTQAKQDLEILKRALEKYADEDMWETCNIWEVEYIQSMFLEYGYKIAKEALEQINHIANVSKMVEHKEI